MPDNETIVSTSPTQEVIPQTQDNSQTIVDVKSFIEEGMRHNGLIPASADNQQAQGATTLQDAPKPEPVLIPIDTFKEFGYDNQERIINDLREYQTLKTAPPKVEPIKFENEESEKLFRAWQGGKKDEVYNYLAEQKKLEQYASADVDEHTANEILKLEMQVKYKDLNLSPQEIDYKFNKQYGTPKEPIQFVGEDDDEFGIRKTAWQEQVDDIKMQKVIDAKIAKPNIVAAKANLKFPELNNTADNGYIEYQENLKLGEQIEAEDREAYKIFTPKSIETRAKFIDEANGIDFEFQYEPDSESFNKAVDMASDINKFFRHFIGQDGKPDRQRFLKAVDSMLNEDKRILEAIKQGKNAAIKAKLPDNTTGGLVKQFGGNGNTEPSEFDKNMQMALGAWQPRTQNRVR